MKMSIGERGTKANALHKQRPGVKPPMFAYYHGKGRFVRSTSRIWKVIYKRVIAQDREVPGLKL